MKKRLGILIVLVCAFVLMTACSSGGAFDSSNESGAGASIYIGDSTRKIIYTYDCSLTTTDMSGTVDSISSVLAQFDDAFVQESNISSESAYLKLRVKTENYAELIAAIPDAGTVVSVMSSAQDVTNNYLSLEAKKTSVEKQLDRLNELYDKASLYEMINISSQIQSVEQELFSIMSQIQNYDSLVSLCTVNINIYLEGASSPFGDSLKGAIGWVWDGVYNVLLMVVIVLPFGAVAAGISVLVYYVVNKRKRKNKKAAAAKNNNGNNISVNNGGNSNGNDSGNNSANK